MANFNRLQEIYRGYILITPNSLLSNIPSQTFVTPGICANNLYNRFTPLYSTLTSPDNPFVTQKKLIGDQKPLLSAVVLEEVPQIQQVGSGDSSGGVVEAEKSSDRAPSPYNDQKVNEVLQAMRNAAYVSNVKVVNETKVKQEERKPLPAKRKSDSPSTTVEVQPKQRKFFKWH